MPAKIPRLALLPLALLPLVACTDMPRAVNALPAGASPRTEALAVTRDALTGAAPAAAAPVAAPAAQFTAVGMAQVSTQPGKSLNEKRLMAIRAARLEALRDLTEQIYGIRLTSESTLRDETMRSDSIRAAVAGEIRGARTLRITPKGNDSFQVVMALDPDTVAYILRAARKGG